MLKNKHARADGFSGHRVASAAFTAPAMAAPVSIDIAVGPPPPRVEVVPAPRHGYICGHPGYWDWRGGHHYWVGWQRGFTSVPATSITIPNGTNHTVTTGNWTLAAGGAEPAVRSEA